MCAPVLKQGLACRYRIATGVVTGTPRDGLSGTMDPTMTGGTGIRGASSAPKSRGSGSFRNRLLGERAMDRS